MIHVLDFLGFTSTNKMYNFWSGIGSDLTELAVVGGIWHNFNCHEKGCWRPGHMVNGTRICHKHRKVTPL